MAQGDGEAFSLFYDAFAATALGLIRRVLRDPGASEDVLQEVFWQIWREAGQYDPQRGRPEAWLLMRAKTRAIDKLRSIRRRERTLVMSVDEGVAGPGGAGSENAGAAVEDRGLVQTALAELPSAQRRAIELAFFEGLTQSEISARRATRDGQDARPAGTRTAARRAGGRETAGDMSREEIRELAAVYALGGLDGEDLARFEALLWAGDADAITALSDLETALLGLAAESAEAPPSSVKLALMKRLAAEGRAAEPSAAVEPVRPRRLLWPAVWTAALAAGIAAIAVGLSVSATYDKRLDALAREAAVLRDEIDRQEQVIALVGDPTTAIVVLSGLEPAPAARARMLWNAPAGGLLVAAGLPPAPAGKAYQLWAIAGKNPPVSAGVFTVDARGAGSLRVSPLPGVGKVDVFAVTLEPAGGLPAPSGAMYLAGKS